MPGKIIGNFDTCSSYSLIRIEIPVIQVIALKSLQSGDFLWNNSKRKQRDNSGETVKEQRQNATCPRSSCSSSKPLSNRPRWKQIGNFQVCSMNSRGARRWGMPAVREGLVRALRCGGEGGGGAPYNLDG